VCERGIRTFEPIRAYHGYLRIPIVKKSLTFHRRRSVHGTGRRDKVAAWAAPPLPRGRRLLVEVHNCPDQALSDGAQSLYPSSLPSS